MIRFFCVLLFFFSCGKNKNKLAESYLNQEKKFSILQSSLFFEERENKEFIIEGGYLGNCFGKSKKDIWRISSLNSENNYEIYIKKGNSDCKLNFKKLIIKNNENNYFHYSIDFNYLKEDFYLTDEFFPYPLKLILINKEDSLQKKIIYFNIRIKKNYFPSKPEIEVQFTDLIKQEDFFKEADVFEGSSFEEDFKGISFSESKSLSQKYVYNIYSFGKALFAIVNSQKNSGLYYSRSGISGNFEIIRTIPKIEVFSLARGSNVTYVAAYNFRRDHEALGGLYYSFDTDAFPSFQLVPDLKNFRDIIDVSAERETVYALRTDNSVFFTIDGVLGEFKKVKNIPRKDIKNIYLSNNQVFLPIINENNELRIYYSKDAKSGVFEEINFSFEGSKVTGVVSFRDEIYISTNKSLYFSSHGVEGGFLKFKEFNDIEIYGMKLFKNKLYLTIPCQKIKCDIFGVYYKNLEKDLRFKKIFDAPNVLNIESDTEYIYVTSTFGVSYFRNLNYFSEE
jgi:hypothetical protein